MTYWTHSTDDTEDLFIAIFDAPSKIYFTVSREWDEGGDGAHPDLGGGSPAGWIVDVVLSHVVFGHGTELSRLQVLGIVGPKKLAEWEIAEAGRRVAD